MILYVRKKVMVRKGGLIKEEIREIRYFMVDKIIETASELIIKYKKMQKNKAELEVDTERIIKSELVGYTVVDGYEHIQVPKRRAK